ncbi:hypothetical protein [Streptosporangium sp. NBC_01469]|uniref:hypothetical protein n=1 Tax=Streptosporangium sp. NBC_01469 TaxID=2903898 RepID=UPI002E2B8CB4|nr:hypothetical protein [Streptosporangium sp. NBC_01469]
MNDRFNPDKDRLVHKVDEDDDRTVRKFDENDLNATRHGQDSQDTAPEFQEPRPGDADHTDASPLDPDTGTRDPLAGDRDDVLVVESSDDRRATGSDVLLDDDRHDVPGDPDDGRNDSPFAHAQPPAATPGTPVTGIGAHAPVPGAGSPVTPGFPESTADRPDDVLDEGTGFTDAERADQTPAVTAPATAGALFDQDSDDVRRRWQEVQAGFVDDPRDAVERADSLLDEVTSSLRNALETRTGELQGRWKNTEKNDTEDLRTALRDYRATLEQLLNISAGTR